MIKKKILAITLVSTFVLSSVPLYSAQNPSVMEKESQLEYVKSQIIKNQSLIQELNSESSQLMDEMREIDDQIQELWSEIDGINEMLAEKNNEIYLIQDEKYSNQSVLERSKKLIKEFSDKVLGYHPSDLPARDEHKSIYTSMYKMEQLASIYTLNSEVLFNNFSQTESLLDKENKLRKEREIINDQKRLVVMKKDLIQQKYEKKTELYNELNMKMVSYSSDVEDLHIISEQLTNAIKELQSYGYNNVKLGSGSMLWPTTVAGYITSGFVERNNPVSGKFEQHTGLDIGGLGYGREVLAASDGIVITAGWINGYGYAVIIDHGNKVSTLYGHNQKLLVKEGQEVKRGQQIAEVGSTGNSTGPHIHFEVRVDGVPEDPTPWLQEFKE